MGLTTRAQDSSKEKDSGFLGDYYSSLQPDPNNSDLLSYWRNKHILKRSSKFTLDPVTVYLLLEAQQRGIDPEQLARLAQYFTKAIKEELTKGGATNS